MSFDPDGYRAKAEIFLEEMGREYFLHFSGRQDTTDFSGIYQKHAELFTKDAIAELKAAAEAQVAAGQNDKSNLGEVLSFALDGYLGEATKELHDKIAETEAAGILEIGEEEVPYRMSAVMIANESSSHNRQAVEEARIGFVAEHLNPKIEELFTKYHHLAGELGYKNYLELSRALQGTDFEALHEVTEKFLADTEDVYRRELERTLKSHLDIELADATRADLPHLFRATKYDGWFSSARFLPSLNETLLRLGIDLEHQPSVEVDAAHRTNKSPRAFCAPIRVPDEIKLVVMPIGGQDDYQALFHEAGHAEHFAHTDASLPLEFRMLGDNAVTEGFAFLFEHLLHNAEWLSKYIGADDTDEFLQFMGVTKLYFLRRYAGKLAYELEMHQGPPTPELAERYAYHQERATLVPFPKEQYLTDVDEAMYCTSYLRAWLFETSIRSIVIRRFGQKWFLAEEAGDFIKEMWSHGQRYRAEELYTEVGGSSLSTEPLIADIERLLGRDI